MDVLKKKTLFFIAFFGLLIVHSQEQLAGIPFLDSLLLEKDYSKANNVLKIQLDQLSRNNNLDSLKYYPYYVGKIALETSGRQEALDQAEAFIGELRKVKMPPGSLYKAYMKVTDFYDEIGDLNRSLQATEKAFALLLKVPGATAEEIGKIEYNLGVCHLSMGSIDISKKYFQQALLRYSSFPETTAQNLSDGYNAMGAVMWMSTQLDSANHYYEQGINALLKAKGSKLKNLFTATTIRSNVSLVQQSQGDLTAALNTQKEVIAGYEKVIRNAKDTELREKARQNQLNAIFNLSIFYNEIGNLDKARDFILYSYKLAREILNPSDPDLPQYQIALGQVELSLQNYKEAILQSNNGLEGLQSINANDPFWKALAHGTLAKAHSLSDKRHLAQFHFEQGELFFIQALGGSYSTEFLDFLRDKAFFLIQIGQHKSAENTIKKGYDYLKEIGEENNLTFYKSLRDISKAYYLIKDYKNALEWADTGLAKLNTNKSNRENQLNTIQLNLYKSPLLLVKAQSQYALNTTTRTSSFLEQQVALLEEATAFLEQRKRTLINNASINLLNREYQAVNDFAKKLYLELYQRDNKTEHLHKLINLHESGIYSTIRNKLNMAETIGFEGVPESITRRERRFRQRLSKAMNDTREDVNTFFEITSQWDQFLDSIRRAYPKYFKMRYASLEGSLNNLEQEIPKNTTLVRYMFIDNQLYVFIKGEHTEQFMPLDFRKNMPHIPILMDYKNPLSEISNASTTLYHQLWQPLVTAISTQKVIIFPDQELFNLSFELLSPDALKDFKDFGTKGLLAKHDISYNYSLYLLDAAQNTLQYPKDFVAFAPEFDAQMKKDYEIAITDSLKLDNSYLTLLPQPFSASLAKKFSRKFKGTSFLNEKASKQLFTQSAKEHKIIHIGTHAESNNVNPEMSRLVFAKNVSDAGSINDNYLYTYEIYNQNLASHLAILTACETGKPAYQPGEGMISLAHAFNYAGSESILTSLWQIDEQSSTQILSYFYEYLSEGNAKDEALRLAKLTYLETAEGRTLHPQYWAGLVLMGTTDPIELSEPNPWIWLGLFTLVLLIFVAGWMWGKQRKGLQ